MLRVTATGPGLVWLKLDAPGVGPQHFGASDLAALFREFPRGGMKARLAPDGALLVEGATLVAASANLASVGPPPPVDMITDKARRHAAIRAAHAAALASTGTLLRGYSVRVLRPETLAWLRATPVEQWPPIRLTLARDGTPILTDGNHRISVARDFGVGELPARIRTVDGVVERMVGA